LWNTKTGNYENKRSPRKGRIQKCYNVGDEKRENYVKTKEMMATTIMMAKKKMMKMIKKEKRRRKLKRWAKETTYT
jgi:fructosamine-3-kinase